MVAEEDKLYGCAGIWCRCPAKLPRHDDADPKRLSKSFARWASKDQHAIIHEAVAPSHARIMLVLLPYTQVLLDVKYESLRIVMDVDAEQGIHAVGRLSTSISPEHSRRLITIAEVGPMRVKRSPGRELR